MKWALDAKVPGMVHARNVRPPVAGAKLVSIDESSVRGVPGFIKVVSKGNYVAVVCEREEQAIRAARQLKVNWQARQKLSKPNTMSRFRDTRLSVRHMPRHPSNNQMTIYSNDMKSYGLRNGVAQFSVRSGAGSNEKLLRS